MTCSFSLSPISRISRIFPQNFLLSRFFSLALRPSKNPGFIAPLNFSVNTFPSLLLVYLIVQGVILFPVAYIYRYSIFCYLSQSTNTPVIAIIDGPLSFTCCTSVCCITHYECYPYFGMLEIERLGCPARFKLQTSLHVMDSSMRGGRTCRIEMRRWLFHLNQMGPDLYRWPDAIAVRHRTAIDPDERDVRATGPIHMSRLEQDQWKRQRS